MQYRSRRFPTYSSVDCHEMVCHSPVAPPALGALHRLGFRRMCCRAPRPPQQMKRRNTRLWPSPQRPQPRASATIIGAFDSKSTTFAPSLLASCGWRSWEGLRVHRCATSDVLAGEESGSGEEGAHGAAVGAGQLEWDSDQAIDPGIHVPEHEIFQDQNVSR